MKTIHRWAGLSMALALLSSCKSTFERRDPTGEVFPSVRGTALAGKEHKLPEDLAGSPAVLLLGFVMDSQFDIDRWLLGLAQAKADVLVYEVPTIPGLVPGMFAGYIDDGMRSGIPEGDWASVITVYGDGGEIVRFTGNENPRNARVLLLDAKGKVVYFHDRGYSAGTLLVLLEKIQELKAGAPPP